MNKAVKFILFVGVAASVLGLVSMGTANDDVLPVLPGTPISTAAKAWNKQAIDSAISLLRNGQVVLRMGTGAQSQLLAHMNQADKSYSHCGIVLVEGGYPYVYHSIGGEDNPDARLRRDSANRFFTQQHNTAIAIVKYAFTPIQEESLTKTVRGFYSKRPGFDTRFDLATDDQLYCTEFVYKAVTAATGDTAYLPVTSVIRHRYIGTDNLYLNRHASFVWQVKFK